MYLFIGLGNPGLKYISNRHNIGFMVIDKIHALYEFPIFSEKKNSRLSIKILDNEKIILLKPTTFMNLSGISAFNIKSFYNIKNENIYVFHDEIDLKPSEIKIKKGGGNNGHNGLKSIDNYIGNDYYRIRIGIGRPVISSMDKKSDLVSNWVLSDFTKTEKTVWLENSIDLISKNFNHLKKKEFDIF
tara:strand:- start:7 stop:567 length:561 start_codon:yes stop_codon:yes gene_type:complete